MQENGDDCGVFALMFASQLAAGASLQAITPEKIQRLRRYLAYCVLTSRQPQPVMDDVQVGKLQWGMRMKALEMPKPKSLQGKAPCPSLVSKMLLHTMGSAVHHTRISKV